MPMQRVFPVLLSLILLSIMALANEHYLLPENKSDLMRTLKLKIERANNITIITQRLDSTTLSRSIEKRVRSKARLQLITSDLSSASYYAKYRNTIVKVPSSQVQTKTFTLNILLIDNSDICFSSLPFDETVLRRDIGQVICSTDKEDIAFGKEIREKFLKRFETY